MSSWSHHQTTPLNLHTMSTPNYTTPELHNADPARTAYYDCRSHRTIRRMDFRDVPQLKRTFDWNEYLSILEVRSTTREGIEWA